MWDIQDVTVKLREEGEQNRVERLNPHKAAGPDNICPLVLNELVEVIALVITQVF